jgi:hypothetical protein
MTTAPVVTEVRKYVLDLRSLITASEEYVFVRKTFIRLCVFAAIVMFALAGNALIEKVGSRLPDPATWVLSFVDFLILLADAMWFTVSLTREIAEWLEKLGIAEDKKGRKPALVIVILLSVVAVGALVFRKEAKTTFNSVGAVTSGSDARQKANP